MKILWKREEIAPKEQFLLLSTIFCCLLVDFCVRTGIRFSLRDKRLFEISEFEITGVDCKSMGGIYGHGGYPDLLTVTVCTNFNTPLT